MRLSCPTHRLLSRMTCKSTEISFCRKAPSWIFHTVLVQFQVRLESSSDSYVHWCWVDFAFAHSQWVDRSTSMESFRSRFRLPKNRLWYNFALPVIDVFIYRLFLTTTEPGSSRRLRQKTSAMLLLPPTIRINLLWRSRSNLDARIMSVRNSSGRQARELTRSSLSSYSGLSSWSSLFRSLWGGVLFTCNWNSGSFLFTCNWNSGSCGPHSRDRSSSFGLYDYALFLSRFLNVTQSPAVNPSDFLLTIAIPSARRRIFPHRRK